MNKKYLHFRKTYLTKFIKLLKIIYKFFTYIILLYIDLSQP